MRIKHIEAFLLWVTISLLLPFVISDILAVTKEVQAWPVRDPKDKSSPPKASRKGGWAVVSRSVSDASKQSSSALNFKVPAEFHREFKAYAALRGISMVELLQEGFRLIKGHPGG